MKGIKFRVWDKEEKCFLNIYSIGFDGYGNAEYVYVFDDNDSASEPPLFVDDKNLVLMQYTGLKDKNGTEIYEGDILHWQDLSELSDGTLKDNVRVFWDDEYLRLSIETLSKIKAIEKLYDYSDIEEIEVIGNIYETPELLEVG